MIFLAGGFGFVDMGVAEDVRNNFLDAYAEQWHIHRASPDELSDDGAGQVTTLTVLLRYTIADIFDHLAHWDMADLLVHVRSYGPSGRRTLTMLHGQWQAVTKASKKMTGRHLWTVNITSYFPVLYPSPGTTEKATKTRSLAESFRSVSLSCQTCKQMHTGARARHFLLFPE
jgi:hypothetical protein